MSDNQSTPPTAALRLMEILREELIADGKPIPRLRSQSERELAKAGFDKLRNSMLAKVHQKGAQQ
jgi:hypothetical protein